MNDKEKDDRILKLIRVSEVLYGGLILCCLIIMYLSMQYAF